MTWQKEFGAANDKIIEYLLAAVVVLVVIGFLFAEPMLFILIGVFAAYLLLNRIYDKKIGEKLELKNPRRTIRLFPGDDAVLEFELQNRSIFPIVNGAFQFQTESSIKAKKYVDSTSKYWNQYQLPLSVVGKGKTMIRLPIQGEQRGVSKIKNIAYQFPHMFNFDSVTLKYDAYFHIEYVVFPKPIPVKGLSTLSHVAQGSQRTNISPYEDVQSPRGTREYCYSDPFHHINWKASAKTQGLQTNVYDKIIDMSYVFIVNIGTNHGLNMAQLTKNLENLLSYTAYLCQQATETGYPYEVLINARRPGNIPYVHMLEGEGKTHYVNTLDMLARIHPQSMVVPFDQMLYRAGQSFIKPKTIVVIGDIPTDAERVMEKWKHYQKNIFHVEETVDGAYMKRMEKDVAAHAK